MRNYAKNINFYIFKHYLKWDTSKTNEEMTEEEIADFFFKNSQKKK
jgi:hypothetical protein